MLDALQAADRWLFFLLYDAGGEWLRWVAIGITHLGSKGGVWIIGGPLLAIFGRGEYRRLGLALIAMLLANVLLNELLLKHLVGRVRPWRTLGVTLHDTWVDPHGYSFASGHSLCAFAGCLILAARWPRWRWPLVGLAALIALSRVYLGAHYPSDIIVGALLGTAAGLVIVRLFKIAPVPREAATAPEAR
jgi:undecaprenyl-diphosphatase